ncbi:MAG: ferritin-like domain-containing protein [Chloroflexi bacterium]|nr:ferritin-like domain-containing protein [Chloroflexota bacterium]
MAISPEVLEQLRTETSEVAPLDLSWLNLDNAWGIRAKPGKRGLTLDEVEIGPYGDVPQRSDNATFRPRGAVARPEALRVKLPYQERADVYADNLRLLYEEAVQRQWSSATDVPWETIEPLPDNMELAMCQLCTFLTEVEFIAGDTPGQWMPKINSDYHEVKLFLLSQIMDEARHLDVFRKRALANGGGLLSATAENGLRRIIEAQDFTEMSAVLHILGEGFVQTLFRMGEYIAQNEAEKKIYRLAAQDESRHVAFGVMHLKHIVEEQPGRREELHWYYDQAESILRTEGVTGAQYTTQAIALLAGRGDIDKGVEVVQAILRKQVNEYMHRLEVAGLGDRRDRMSPWLKPYLDPPAN